MSIFQALIIMLVVWFLGWVETWYAYPMISIPLVICPIVGLILGDPVSGIIMGATLQLIFLGVMGIGGTLPADAVLGSVIGTAFAITTGQSIETALTFAVPISILGSFFTLTHFLINGLFNPLIERYCEEGNSKGLERTHFLISWVPQLPRMLVLFLALAFGTAFAQAMVDALPPVIQAGLDYASDLMPAVGIALLLKMMWSKRMAVYFFLGFVLVSFFNVPLLAVVCVGIIVAVIMVLESKTPAPAMASTNISAKEEMFGD